MDKLRVRGGVPLVGKIAVGGAKNAALPALFAALLTARPCRFCNVPQVADAKTAAALLRELGAEAEVGDGQATVCAERIKSRRAPYRLVKTMRASILALGPLLARFGEAEVSLPGGCALGARPVEAHLEGLRQMGARIDLDNGYIRARADGGLRGARIKLRAPTVTGTENLMMAAALAAGETTIENAAREPEVADLADLLRAMGASISGGGDAPIVVRGAAELNGASHAIMPDRIEAGTYLAAVAACGGEAVLRGADLTTMTATAAALSAAGLEIRQESDGLAAKMEARPRAADIITAPYPGFPTDMQAQLMAVNALAAGRATITETIFERRFAHAQELARMGADIVIRGDTAVVAGVAGLRAAEVMASDLRAGAALLIAALAAKGESVIHRIYHLDRGYENIEQKLAALGASVRRVS